MKSIQIIKLMEQNFTIKNIKKDTRLEVDWANEKKSLIIYGSEIIVQPHMTKTLVIECLIF